MNFHGGGTGLYTPIAGDTPQGFTARPVYFGDKIWGKYGFADALNPLTGWASLDMLGLDVGMTLLSAENLRSGTCGAGSWPTPSRAKP